MIATTPEPRRQAPACCKSAPSGMMVLRQPLARQLIRNQNVLLLLHRLTMTNLRALCPAIRPYETGHLEVGDGHCIHCRRAGTRASAGGVSTLAGPGGGISPERRGSSIRPATT